VSWSLGASSRSAVNGLKESLASVADFLVWLVINVPVIVLWIAIVFVLVVAGWYVLRLAIRLLKAMFVSRQG
jgi:ABC-type amino acid transport system permease subunit